MDQDTRLAKLKEARGIVHEVQADIVKDENMSQKAMMHMQLAANELHRARVELGMYEEHGLCGWKEVEARRKRESGG